MNDRVAPLVTTLSVLAFVAWLALSSRTTVASDPRVEIVSGDVTDAIVRRSMPACGRLVPWRVADVDPRFGLSADAVEAAAREAAALWEAGVGRPLFVMDGEAGIPVRLVYDHRQARTDERARAEARVRDEDEVLTMETSTLSRMWEDHHDALASHARAHRDLAAAVEAHNRLVREWNEGGGASGVTAEAMLENENRLRVREERLAEEARRLEGEEDDLRDAERELMTKVAARNAEIGRLEQVFPPVAVESGMYMSAERLGAQDEGLVRREIRIFRFQDGNELVRVLAHEFGHALGVGHVEDASALMHGHQAGTAGTGPLQSLHPADVRALEEYCRAATPR